MIAPLVGEPCPKSCHTAPQPTLEEAFAEQTSAVANFNLSSLLLIGLRRAQMEPLRIGSRMYCTGLRGTEARHMTMPITDCWQKTSIRRTRHFVALILSRVECVTVPSIPLLTSMLRARPRGLRPQYSCGAGLLRVAQLPQVRCLVRVHPRDRRTEPRHKGAPRFQ